MDGFRSRVGTHAPVVHQIIFVNQCNSYTYFLETACAYIFKCCETHVESKTSWYNAHTFFFISGLTKIDLFSLWSNQRVHSLNTKADTEFYISPNFTHLARLKILYLQENLESLMTSDNQRYRFVQLERIIFRRISRERLGNELLINLAGALLTKTNKLDCDQFFAWM